MIRIKIWLSKVLRRLGCLNASLRITESAQSDLVRKADKLRREIEKTRQEGK